MTEELPPEVTKHSFRLKVWDYLMKNELLHFPLSVYNRIPNFKGAAEAASRLAELDEFKKAHIIKINPDKPQEPVRFLALEANKEILVPIPRLRSGLFFLVTPVAGISKNELRTLSKIHGLSEAGKPLGIDSKIKIDLVILGSVCVSRDGYRLGKGKGFADLEFAMMMRMGAVTQDTTVITTVHDCQVVDSLPPSLFKEYDVPVDIIVTPTETIIVNPRLKKPTSIIWNMLSEKRLEAMPVLQQMKEMDEKDGIVVTLGPNETDYVRNRRPHRPKRGVFADGCEGEREKPTKKSLPRGHSFRKAKADGDTNVSSSEVQEKLPNGAKQRSKKPRSKSMLQINFSLKLSNISSYTRIRDLKNELSVRGVKPNKIAWQGCRGICYLHFNKLKKKTDLLEEPIQVDSIMANLRDLRIGESSKETDFIIVEPTKPIPRIEVTDVTAV